MKKIAAALLTALLMAAACGGGNNTEKPDINNPDNPDPTPVNTQAGTAMSYTTNASASVLFKENSVPVMKGTSSVADKLSFTSDSFQTIDGFGAAVTVSSCYNLLKMTKGDRTTFLKEVFDPENGIGSSLIRVCIGGSDFTWDYENPNNGRYTWCDDEGLENFAPHEMDVKYVLPVLYEIFEINPSVKIIASPWTAPRWMKTGASSGSDGWTGGRLASSHYQDYAQYFVKWIQYFEAQGFPIYAVTTQNEPLNAGNSMSMLMPWTDCRDFVKNALGPAFEAAGLKTKILIFDHNYNYDDQSAQASYPLKVYNDADASKYIAGSAWHNYGGNVSELDKIVAGAPDKEIYFTEASIGTWNYKFDECLINDFRDIFIGTMSRGGKGVTLWNLMLDSDKGPYTNASGSCNVCYGAANISRSDYKTIARYTHYYNIAHASKVIRPGAVRTGFSGTLPAGVSGLAFRNTDGSYGIILLNENASNVSLSFVNGDKFVDCLLPPKAIFSLKADL